MAVVQAGGQSPLHLAAAKGRPDCVALLLNAAASNCPLLDDGGGGGDSTMQRIRFLANARDLDGCSALVSACLRWVTSDETNSGSAHNKGDAVSSSAADESLLEGFNESPDASKSVARYPPDGELWKIDTAEANLDALVSFSSASLSPSLATVVALLLPWTNTVEWEDVVEDRDGSDDRSSGSSATKRCALPTRDWLKAKRQAVATGAGRRVKQLWAIPPHLEPVGGGNVLPHHHFCLRKYPKGRSGLRIY